MIDTKGFIWIGHELGVSRYDGQSFVSYTNDKRSSMAMDNLIEDNRGRIWCKNFNGQLFYIEHDHMHLLQTRFPNLNINQFTIAGDKLVAKCNGGLFVHDLLTGNSKIIRSIPPDLLLDTIISESILSYGKQIFLLIQLKHKTSVYTYEDGSFIPYHANLMDIYNRIIDDVRKQYRLLKGVINDSLTYFTIQGKNLLPIQSFNLPGAYALSSRVGKETWIHTPKESIQLHGNQIIHNLSLTDYIEDREGNQWAGSLLYGLLMKKKPTRWRLYPIRQKGDYITALALWQQQVVAGTSRGRLLVGDTATFFRGDNRENITFPGQKSFSNIFIYGDKLFIYGSHNPFSGSNLFTLSDKGFGKTKGIYSSEALSRATSIENKAVVWAGNSSMVALPVSNSRTNGQHTDQSLPGIITRHFKKEGHFFIRREHKKRVRGICYDSTTKTLYAGFSDGLFAYTKDSVREVQWKHDPVYAYDIKPYQGKLYIATLNKGVLILQGGKITGRLHKGNDTSSSILKLKIQGNHLWVIGVDDIQRYDFKRKKFLSSISFPPIKGVAVEDLLELNGSVYLSTTEGIYQVPLSGNQKKVLPLNYLLYTIVNNSDTISEGAVLPYKKNSLQFNLAGLYYADPGGVYFRYRLLGSGADTNWKQTPPGQREILFPYVMPGHYTFEAAAYTATGLKAKNMLHFSFSIQKPWWQQWWFLFSIVAATGGIIYLLISMRMKAKKEAYRLTVARLEHESERLQYENVANESELKALKSQMNPHFIANALNTIQELFMKGERNMASEQLGNFATLTRMVLNVSGKKFILLETEIDILEKYLALEKMRFREGFSYDIVIDEEIDEGYIQIPPMILQPFVENSVKHGLLHKRGDKYLKITFTATPDNEHLVCTITDNGVGRARAAAIRRLMDKQHDSFSIEALKKRLDLMGKAAGREFIIEYTDMKDSEGVATGTSVRISIPIFTT